LDEYFLQFQQGFGSVTPILQGQSQSKIELHWFKNFLSIVKFTRYTLYFVFYKGYINNSFEFFSSTCDK